MTQTEYENKPSGDTPKREPIGSVVIENFHMWSMKIMIDGRLTEVRTYQITLWGKPHGPYRTNPKYPTSKTLYTTDDHGNIDQPSCFREPDELTTVTP
jgi:hypothetical protein